MNWTCPYCQHTQVLGTNLLTTVGFHRVNELKDFGIKEEQLASFQVKAINCLNKRCQRTSLSLQLGTVGKDHRGSNLFGQALKEWQLVPASSAKPQPNCIPAVLRTDYQEACAIAALSPKASATLSRRVLQGMIRDFCGISKRRLVDEINALQVLVNEGKAPAGVSAESVEAIDHVRGIGNIGAHMEKDINHIIGVDPQEARLLIELIEILFKEWYVERKNRARAWLA